MSWTPNESAQTLFAEDGWLQGTIVSAVAYGINVALYFMCFYLLIRQMTSANYKKHAPFIVYITVSFILGSLFMGSLAEFTQLAFIQDRKYPGGPNMFEQNEFSISADEIGNVAFVLSNWLADALVVWRCMVIYRGCRVPLWIVMIFPSLMLAGSFAMGILWLLQISTSSPYFSGGINFTLPYLSLSLALNITLTIAIVLRLLTYRYRISRVLGPKYGTQYTSVAAMVVESAALYSVFSIAFLVLFALNNPVSETFLEALGQIQMIATLLIVFRVAQGKGWSKSTANSVMSGTKLSQPIRMSDFRVASGFSSKTAVVTSGVASGVTVTRETEVYKTQSDLEFERGSAA
ncbi:hypothetical protein BJ138DRAFT_1155435 [Hygrophoropsis aurantiaca]|uniref:Uncharacterized protein n=1 Tax=Hygrophoropsis aurantiaca TaxID=72124 RepID=A0ACB8A8H8_9AGAM|nr:hypothetical protein BJ138DRAFT_1155435 [Hygrophoropsis aurantiaca]